MDPWDEIRRAAADRRSGSVEVALRAARAIRALTTKTDIRRAARRLVRAHPAMAPVWRLLATAYEADEVEAAVDDFTARLASSTEGAADGVRWAVTSRRVTVVTHSASGSVVRALERVRSSVARVVCTASLPGGEGRPLARKLTTLGFEVEVVADAEMMQACLDADVLLLGADAVTEDAVVNKVGSYPAALAAREAGIGSYAIASTLKLLPHRIWEGGPADAYEATPLDLFDAILTERGPRRRPAIRRAARRIQIPVALERISR